MGKEFLPVICKKTFLLGSTFNAESGKDLKQFDFVCQKTKTYQVILFSGKANQVAWQLC